jgi:hypothetical protein
MQSFLMRGRDSQDVKSAPINDRMLSFDPSHVVQAITFHLLDEGRALGVGVDSCEEAIARLSERFEQITISSDEWSVMENERRLGWLLEQSHVVVQSGESGCATLLVQ